MGATVVSGAASVVVVGGTVALVVVVEGTASVVVVGGTVALVVVVGSGVGLGAEVVVVTGTSWVL